MFIRLVLRALKDKLSVRRMRDCRLRPRMQGDIFRVDAKAEGNEVAIGGWLSWNGTPPSEAQWFAVRLTKSNAPWAFRKGEPFCTIASLELLAVLVTVMVLVIPHRASICGAASGCITLGGRQTGKRLCRGQTADHKIPLAGDLNRTCPPTR